MTSKQLSILSALLLVGLIFSFSESAEAKKIVFKGNARNKDKQAALLNGTSQIKIKHAAEYYYEKIIKLASAFYRYPNALIKSIYFQRKIRKIVKNNPEFLETNDNNANKIFKELRRTLFVNFRKPYNHFKKIYESGKITGNNKYISIDLFKASEHGGSFSLYGKVVEVDKEKLVVLVHLSYLFSAKDLMSLGKITKDFKYRVLITMKSTAENISRIYVSKESKEHFQSYDNARKALRAGKITTGDNKYITIDGLNGEKLYGEVIDRDGESLLISTTLNEYNPNFKNSALIRLELTEENISRIRLSKKTKLMLEPYTKLQKIYKSGKEINGIIVSFNLSFFPYTGMYNFGKLFKLPSGKLKLVTISGQEFLLHPGLLKFNIFRFSESNVYKDKLFLLDNYYEREKTAGSYLYGSTDNFQKDYDAGTVIKTKNKSKEYGIDPERMNRVSIQLINKVEPFDVELKIPLLPTEFRTMLQLTEDNGFRLAEVEKLENGTLTVKLHHSNERVEFTKENIHLISRHVWHPDVYMIQD